MRDYVIMSDVNCDIDPAFAEEKGIAIFPQYYHFNDGVIYGDEIKLAAKVQDVNLSYRLIWEANDSDDRGWYTIASGENYSYTLSADNVAREYRVVLFSLD